MSTTVEELEALPEGAVVRSGIGEHAVKRHTGRWATWHNPVTLLTSAELTAYYDQIEVLYPQPEPDHSMCARLAWDGDSWTLKHPNGGHVISFSADQARDRGYPIPHTVEERVAAALRELDVDDDLLDSMAARLAELGLLAKDGERNE